MIYDVRRFDFHWYSLAALRRLHGAHVSAILLIQCGKVLYELSGWPPSDSKWARYNKMIGRKGADTVSFGRGANLALYLK